MKTLKTYLIICTIIASVCAIITGVFCFGVESEKQSLMYEAFQHGYAAPVRNDNDGVTYEWIEPNLLLNEPPELEQ